MERPTIVSIQVRKVPKVGRIAKEQEHGTIETVLHIEIEPPIDPLASLHILSPVVL